MLAGFWINVVSGFLLFAPEATRWTFHADFQLKMTLVFLGMLIIYLIRREVSRPSRSADRITGTAKSLAAASITVWLVAITAGRLTAYVDGLQKFISLFTVAGA